MRIEIMTDAILARFGADIVNIYVEVESGRKVSNRPQIITALAHARRTKSTLVIAKLDRLARNVAFISSVMDAGVDFVACDNPPRHAPEAAHPRRRGRA